MSRHIDVLEALRQIANGEGDTDLLALKVHGAVAELIRHGEALLAAANGIRGAYESGHKPSRSTTIRFSESHGKFGAALANAKPKRER